MKNITKIILIPLFLSAFFMVVSTVNAQEFKIIQGFNLSYYSIQSEEYVSLGLPPYVYDFKINFAMGLLLGGGIEFNVSKNIAIEIDALYFQKGSIIKANGVLDWNYDLNVVSFPILIKIKLRSGPPAYFLGGGELSLILKHERDGYDITEDTKTFDYGLVTGGGIEIKIKNSTVCLEGRYHFGLKNILIGHWRLESVKTKAIVLLLGIKI